MKAVVLFDGECAFCRKSVGLLQRLNWIGRVECRDCRDRANLPPCGEPLDEAKLLEEMHVVTPDRRRALVGYLAIRWLAWRLPPLWLIAPFFYLPGTLWLGTRLYRRIARNRYSLIPCDHGQCRIDRKT
jgi:predicted DCC family thiol-disulfide oxidoreductase YuxK